MNLIVGLGLFAALIAVIVLFAVLFGPSIAAATRRAAKGDAASVDTLAALTVVGLVGSDGGSSCDGGGGGD